MPTILRARSTPYPPTFRADQCVCPRCGITFLIHTSRKHITHCRDCRDYVG